MIAAKTGPTRRMDDGETTLRNETPTLSRTTGHVSANLAKSHEMADEIENALFGPGPCCDPEKQCSTEGLLSMIDHNAAMSASLAYRLEQIAARIGRRETR